MKDEDTRLRDQFAIAAMSALISRVSHNESASSGKPYLDNDTICRDIAIASYKIADAMRKARLQSFD